MTNERDVPWERFNPEAVKQKALSKLDAEFLKLTKEGLKDVLEDFLREYFDMARYYSHEKEKEIRERAREIYADKTSTRKELAEKIKDLIGKV